MNWQDSIILADMKKGRRFFTLRAMLRTKRLAEIGPPFRTAHARKVWRSLMPKGRFGQSAKQQQMQS